VECYGSNFDAPEIGGEELADYQERVQTSARVRLEKETM